MDRYSVIAMADAFINMLHYHSEMGAAMRKVMTQALINPQLYYQLAVCKYWFNYFISCLCLKCYQAYIAYEIHYHLFLLISTNSTCVLRFLKIYLTNLYLFGTSLL